MRPSGLIKRRGSESAFMRENLDKCEECFVWANILNLLNSLSDILIKYDPFWMLCMNQENLNCRVNELP